MKQVTSSELIDFARTIDGGTMFTLRDKLPFKVHLAGAGLKFIRDGKKERAVVNSSSLDKLCLKYSQYNSTKPTDYKESFSASYFVALIDAFHKQRDGDLRLDARIPICADLPQTSILPNRVQTTVSRILRDRPLISKLKRGYDFRCQLCEMRLELPNGFFYCEAHHIQPLGAPHYGYDLESNLVIVCPNHHVLLDYGAISLSKDSLRLDRHSIGQSYLDYHNTNIHKVA